MTNIQQQAPGTAAPAKADVAGYAAPDGASPIHWFRDITRTDIARVGGKGANLGEMTRAGLPVPRGFVIGVDAYARFRLDAGIGPALDRELATLNVDDSAALQAASARLRAIVEGAATPPALAERIEAAYHELCGAAEQDCLVAVRSSATAEDTAEFSFAGMFESFLNVSGGEELVKRVRSCWASTFHARVLYYRIRNGMAAEMPVAVIVQRMIQSEKAGVLFTVDPATRNPDLMVVEAAWGLGEVVVLGQVTPDHYVLDKKSLEIRSRAVNRKEFMLARTDAGATTRIELASDPRADAAVLGDAELRALGELGRETEAHYGAAQDIEFAEAGGTIYLTQTRPITTLGTGQGAQTPNASAASASSPLLQGLGASPGIASGQVRVLSSPSSSAELRDGEVLVAPMTSPDWVPLMRRAVAVVTDSGGMTSHAAIVSRELGIPCVVGTREGTRRLTTGQVVTVDGKAGTITSGAVRAPGPVAPTAPAVVGRAAPITATKLYVNLGEPDRAAEAAAMDVDGVGLLRAEFMLLSALEGAHPRQILQEGHADDLVQRFVTHLRVFAHAFAPRPVVYRAMDFRTNEFRGLRGGDRIEPHEDNPMIGYRGCYRYVREPDLFALELRALADVRRELPNLQLMIPFVRTGWELRECMALIDASPLGRDRGLQRWVMAEVPSVVHWLPEYVRMGITGVSIGSNDLTQLVLGVDRDSEHVAPLFDERDPAVLAAIHAIIAQCRRLGVTSSICGQAPSVHPEYAEQLVRWGIDSISVNPDVVDLTRRSIAAAEHRVLLAHARDGAAEAGAGGDGVSGR